MNLNIKKNLKTLMKKIEYRANYLLKHHYKKYIHMDYNILIIENLMSNGRCHLVAVFKNYLIEDDTSEYLRRFYKAKESAPRLKKLFLYHDETSVIFPNYTPLIESQYLYNNVIRKQRVIDEQQSLENKRNELKLNKNNLNILKKEDRLFNSTILGEILTQSESVLRIVFGIEKNEKKSDESKKIDFNNLNINNNEDSDYVEFKQIINKMENAEENINIANNNNSLVGYKLNSNNVLKYKLKLVNNPNNMQSKYKNYEKLNNITNNSTNITNSSNNNNINSNINLNIIKNIQNIGFKGSIFQTKKVLKQNEKIKNNLTITYSNLKNKEKNYINSYNNLTIPSKKKSNSTIPTRTLYGLNYHKNNNLVNNLVKNQEKKIKNNNSISHSNNTSRINTHNNNYKNNNNYPKNKFINNQNQFYSTIKPKKLMNRIPKIDINKLDVLNNKKFLALTNRNSNRNNNYILNNPNLFFAETEILKSERNLIKKRSTKKEIMKNMMNHFAGFTPSNSKAKDIFGRDSNRKLILINEPNIKSLSQKKNKQYFSNKNININEANKNLIINEYNFKANQNLLNKENYSNKFHKKIYN